MNNEHAQKQIHGGCGINCKTQNAAEPHPTHYLPAGVFFWFVSFFVVYFLDIDIDIAFWEFLVSRFSA
jgi:hypothetical protein